MYGKTQTLAVIADLHYAGKSFKRAKNFDGSRTRVCKESLNVLQKFASSVEAEAA